MRLSNEALTILQWLHAEYLRRYPNREDAHVDLDTWATRRHLFECWLLEDAATGCQHAMYELRGRCDLPVFGE